MKTGGEVVILADNSGWTVPDKSFPALTGVSLHIIINNENDNIIRSDNMAQLIMDLLLHPVRMAIVQNLLGERKLTAQKLGEMNPDVPQATLYRHIHKLLESGVIEVVAENRVRGTVEKIYGLAEKVVGDLDEDFLKATKEDQKRYFFTYLMSLMNEYEAYIGSEGIDMVQDGLTYRRGRYYMNDEEFEQFVRDLQIAYRKIIRNKPGEGRRSRTVGLIIVPDPPDTQ